MERIKNLRWQQGTVIDKSQLGALALLKLWCLNIHFEQKNPWHLVKWTFFFFEDVFVFRVNFIEDSSGDVPGI